MRQDLRVEMYDQQIKARRCKLKPAQPVLKAPRFVSA